MGLETAVNHPLVVEPKHLIQAADPNIVTPTAVDALTDAFRKGAITADDIKQHAQQTQKNQIDIENAQREQAFQSNPMVIEARKSAAIAAGSIAKAQQAQAESNVKLAPLTEQLDRASKIKAILGDESLTEPDKFGAAFNLAGIAPPKRDDGTIDVDAARPLISAYNDYNLSLTRLATLALPHSTEQREQKLADGRTIKTAVRLNALGQPIDSEDEKALMRLTQLGFAGYLAHKNLVQPKPGVAPTAGPTIEPTAPEPMVQPVSPTDKLTSGLNGLKLSPGEWSVALKTFNDQGATPEAADNVLRAWNMNKGSSTETPITPTQTPLVEPKGASNLNLGQEIPGQGRVVGLSEPPSQTPPTPAAITDQFRKQKSYEQWNQSKPFYGAMVNTMEEINKIPVSEQRKGNANLNLQDIELVSNFIKLYDPNAVVREFKWDKIEHSQPIPDQVRNWMSTITREGHLTPETRQQLFKVGTQAFHAKEQSIVPDLQMASKIATDAGYNLQHILTPEESSLLTGGGAHYKEPTGAISTPNGNKPVTLSNGKRVVRGADGRLYELQ